MGKYLDKARELKALPDAIPVYGHVGEFEFFDRESNEGKTIKVVTGHKSW